MLIKRPSDILASEITDRVLFERRRDFLMTAGLGSIAATATLAGLGAPLNAYAEAAFAAVGKSPFSTTEKPNSHKDATTYNNYYEFGTDKADPARNAHTLKTRPWTVGIEGLVARPQTLAIEDILKLAPLEERIYRMRCVEGWSMVIPWIGFPLEKLVRKAEPLGSAKFVEFYTLNDPLTMPGVSRSVLDWPYVEGLRMDEALHPLSIMVVGLYGEELPKQNGAPLRVMSPWKYGFKGGKSIVRIRFVEKQPVTSWMRAAAHEYGFYANVNPEVDHPRWSQGSERRLGEFRKRKTLMFNGYADQVGQLYAGMDLKRNF